MLNQYLIRNKNCLYCTIQAFCLINICKKFLNSNHINNNNYYLSLKFIKLGVIVQKYNNSYQVEYFLLSFQTICIIDFIILLFSCLFFIIPFQQLEFKQQQIIEKETQDWGLNLIEKGYQQYNIEARFQRSIFAIEQHDLISKTWVLQIFWICLQRIYNKEFKLNIIQKLPQCNDNLFWKGEKIQFLVEICLKISVEDNQLSYQGGCYRNGLVYKELDQEELQPFENL
ncbi:unnamed protein product [Paramecium sonneborni]|uniref:Transmembrane protein n=1 Tax=Paramecium sonneborni TaxID=65129 RepID=A0A8S1PT82_9CILI|nr:unnamed protein product [Paramecium sonneborni]